MVSRPTVGIISADGSASGSTHPLPTVFSSPIRPDIVQYVACQNAAKNALMTRIDLFTLAWQRTNANPTPSVRKQESRHRPSPGELVRSQSFETSHSCLIQHPGRAVARIPRVSGGGTHRAGQAAFGNQCRSGRMFAPTKVWRKWHRKINLGQK